VSTDAVAQIAKKSDGFSGADLENVVNESAYICIHKNREEVVDDDILEAFAKVQEQRR
jgi:ATP-dependent 26S proteasome regulatory subunit